MAMQSHIPRLMLAGTNSGCGKTTVTCAILQALVNRGLATGAFKCGPDYIDPMFHSRIIGARAANLDLHFFTPEVARFLLAKHGADRDIAIIEGVMGFYDGMVLTSAEASSYQVAQVTDTPVVLVVNARGAALSVLAVVQGFLSFLPDNHICGVILNQCTAMTYQVLARALEQQFGGQVKPLGFLPTMADCRLESRHLGLVTAQEVADLQQKLQRLARQAEETIALDGLLALARSAAPVCWQAPQLPPKGEPVRIAVARDSAFCFYYEDSLGLLEALGAQLVDFSPLSDSALPEEIQGLYLGGGYPELYAAALSENRAMLDAVGQAIAQGLPCIAECGGFMYLTQAIGQHPMVGALPGSSYDTGKLVRFGYVTLQAQRDNLLCRAGETIAAHEFHHWDSTACGEDFLATKASGRQWPCVFANDTLYAGYPHFHFYANPQFAIRFYNACIKEKQRHA